VILARRVEFSLIAIGGCFLILGWGIGHHEWARAVGWLFTGIGFAIEMVYGKVVRATRATEPEPEPEPEPDASVTDESAP
jgi:hypothetical protein